MAKNEYFIRVGAELDQRSVESVYEQLKTDLSRSSKSFKLDIGEFINTQEFGKHIAAMVNASGEIQKVFASLSVATKEGFDDINVVLDKLQDGSLQINQAWEKLDKHGITPIQDLGNRLTYTLQSKSIGNIAAAANKLYKGFGEDVARAFLNSFSDALQNGEANISGDYDEIIQNINSGLISDNIKIELPQIQIDDSYDDYVEDVSSAFESVADSEERAVVATQDYSDKLAKMRTSLEATKNNAEQYLETLQNLNASDAGYNRLSVNGKAGAYTRSANNAMLLASEVQSADVPFGQFEDAVELEKIAIKITDVVEKIKQRNTELAQSFSNVASETKESIAKITSAVEQADNVVSGSAAKKLEMQPPSGGDSDQQPTKDDQKRVNDEYAEYERLLYEVEKRKLEISQLDSDSVEAQNADIALRVASDKLAITEQELRAEGELFNILELKRRQQLVADKLAKESRAAAAQEGVSKQKALEAEAQTRVNQLLVEQNALRRTELSLSKELQSSTLGPQERAEAAEQLAVTQERLGVIRQEIEAAATEAERQRQITAELKQQFAIEQSSVMSGVRDSRADDRAATQNLKFANSQYGSLDKRASSMFSTSARVGMDDGFMGPLIDNIAKLKTMIDGYAASIQNDDLAAQRAIWNDIEGHIARTSAQADVYADKIATAKSGLVQTTKQERELASIETKLGKQLQVATLLGGDSQQAESIAKQTQSLREMISQYKTLLTSGDATGAAAVWDQISAGIKSAHDDLQLYADSLSTLNSQYAELEELAVEAYRAQASAGSVGGVNVKRDSKSAVQAQLTEEAAAKTEKYRQALERAGLTEEQWLEKNTASQKAHIDAIRTATIEANKNADAERDAASAADSDDIRRFWDELAKYQRQNTALSSDLKLELMSLISSVKNGAGQLTNGELASLQERFNKLRLDALALGKTGDNAMTTIGNAYKKFGGWSIVTRSLTYARHLITQIPKNVKELESALAEFSIVTGASGDRLERFGDQAMQTAQEIKVSTTDILDAATVYARLGFSDTDSMAYAKLTSMFAKVGGVEIGDAEDAITALIKAFNVDADQLELALDKMVNVGNNAPISAAQIGEGFNNAAAALAAAGNSMEESIGMLTAANATLQNISQASTAMRTITARIRNSKAELEELGETTDDLAESTAKYRADIKALSGVDIMLDDENFKSTYQILDELAGKWDSLSDISRSSLTTLIAGTRQQSVFASLMTNWDEARKAVELCTEAGGTMSEKYSTYTDTIAAQIDGLKISFSKFSNTILDSDLVSYVIKLADGFVQLSTALSDVKGVNTLLPAAAGLLLNSKNRGLWKQNVLSDNTTRTSFGFGSFNPERGVLLSDIDAKQLAAYNSVLDDMRNQYQGAELAAKALEQTQAGMSDTAKQLARRFSEQGVTLEETSRGFVAVTNSVKPATTVVKGFGMALGNMLASAAIGIAIQLAIKGVQAIVEALKPAEEKIKALQESFDAITDSITSVSTDFRSFKSTSDELIPRFAELAQGVDRLGRNISLTDAEYAEFTGIGNQLAELMPELNRGFDANGNAIIALNGDVETITASLNELVEVQAEAANQKIAYQLPSAFENVTEQVALIDDMIRSEREQAEETEHLIDSLIERRDAGISFWFNAEDVERAERYNDILAELGLHAELFDAVSEGYDPYQHGVDQYWEVDVSELAKITTDSYERAETLAERRISAYNERKKDTWQKLNPIISAWMQTDWNYSLLSYNMQRSAQDLASRIDWNSLRSSGKVNSEEDMKQWVTDNILTPLSDSSLSQEIQDTISDLLSVDTAKLSAVEYGKFLASIREALTAAGLSTEVIAQIMLTFDRSSLNAALNDAKNVVKTRFGASSVYNNGTLDRLDISELGRISDFDSQFGSQYSDVDSYLSGFVEWLTQVSELPTTFSIDEYIGKLGELSGATSVIDQAQKEMTESGVLSFETMQSVMELLNARNLDYLDYLYIENGQIKANTDALREMQRAASDEGVATAEAALQQAREELAQFNARDDLDWIDPATTTQYDTLADNIRTCEKNLKLARSAANAFNKALDNVADGDFWDKASTPMSSIGTLSSAYGELESDGSVSFSSLQKIREAFSDVDDIDRYINTLASAQGNTEETAEVLNQLATAALYTTFTTDELANANEDLVAAMLKEAGVANSVEVAHEAIAKAKEFSTIKSRLLAASEDSERAQILAEAQSAGILSASLAQLNYIKALFSNSSLSTSASVANLITLAKQADVTGTHLIALQKLQQELAQMEIMTATIGTTSKSNYTGGSLTGRYDAYEDTVLGQQQMKINQLEAAAKKSIDFNSILSEVQNMSFDFGDVGGGGGGDESTAAEKIKSAFDELNTVLEHYISLKEAEYNIADRNYDYDGMKTSLQAQVEYYKQIQENAHNAAEQIRAYYRSQGMTAEAIEQQSEIMALQDTWIAAADSINETLDRIANAVKDKLMGQIDDIQSAWQALSDAAEEYSSTGTISIDSLQSLIEAGVEYTSLLVDENGQLNLNEEAVSAVLEAKTQQLAVETALGYIEEVRNALTSENTVELNRLLDVTTAATSSTWDLVYAQAALLNLNGDQYNQLISNINKFRSIATTTVQSVRKSISKTTEDSAGDYKSALDKILDLTMDLIKHEHEDMVDALNDQADAYQDIIDKKKELLEGTKDEQDYEREVAKRLQEVAKLQKQINLLSLDDSREAKAKKVSLEQELADLQYELNDYINDYTLAANQEALDKEAEQYAEYTNDKIKKIEDEVSSTAKLYELAIDRINNSWDSLYQDLMAWNYEYGSTISKDLSAAWDKASEAVQRYGSFAAASAAAAAGNTVGMSQDYSSDILSQQFSNAPQNSGAGGIASLGQQIQAALQSGGGNAVYTASNNRAQPGDLVITNGGIYRKTTGQSELLIPVSDYPSYVDSTGATVKYDADSLYKLLKQNGYIYHTGGIVGSSTMKQDEEMAILQNGELVATEKMQKQLFSMVDFVDNISRKLKALPYANGIGSLLSNNVLSGLQALQIPAAATNNSMVFEPHIEVTIQHNGSISDDDLRGYGDRIAEVTLGKLSEAFQMRGVKSFAGSLLRG